MLGAPTIVDSLGIAFWLILFAISFAIISVIRVWAYNFVNNPNRQSTGFLYGFAESFVRKKDRPQREGQSQVASECMSCKNIQQCNHKLNNQLCDSDCEDCKHRQQCVQCKSYLGTQNEDPVKSSLQELDDSLWDDKLGQ